MKGQRSSADINAHLANIHFHANRYGEALLRIDGEADEAERAERLSVAVRSVPSWAIDTVFDTLPPYIVALCACVEADKMMAAEGGGDP